MSANRPGRALAPAALVLVALIVLPAAFGAPVGQMLIYLLDEVGFALLPGMAAYVALAGAPGSRIRLVALGYAVGLVLQVAAFGLTAAVGARWLIWAYPPIVVIACVPALRSAMPGFSAPLEPRRWHWGLAVACVVALVWVSAAYFPFQPLPSSAHSVVYIPDLLFHLGVAAEALHHWPITDPKVTGTALPYELFVYMKLAASAQTTHLQLGTILFRLYLLPLVAAIMGLLYCAATQISGRRSAGVLAAALFVLVGQLGLAPRDPLVFYNTIFFSLYDSPSFVFGLVVFLGTLCVLLECLSSRGSTGRRWLLLALMLAGCSGAKATILPDLIGALAILVIVSPRARRRGAAALVLTGAIFAVSYAVLYQGGSGGLKVDLPGSVRSMDFSSILHSWVPGIPSALFWVLAAVVGLVGFCGATLAGVPALVRGSRFRAEPHAPLLLGLLATSLIPFLVFTHKGGSQNFFTYYGVCGACVLSGQGLSLVLAGARARWRPLAWAALAWAAVLLAVAVLPYELSANPSERGLLALWLGLPAVALLGLWAAARRFPERRGALAAVAATVVVVNGALDTPLHLGDALVPPLLHGRALYVRDSPEDRGLTPALWQGLTWVRRHLPTDAVIAVNNQYSDSHRQDPSYYYYSAFGERRIFLEGWYDTVPAAGISNPAQTPFAGRLFLNDELFKFGSRAALAVMEHRYGVGYLLVDRLHGPSPSDLASLGQVEFRNPGMILLRALPVSSPR